MSTHHFIAMATRRSQSMVGTARFLYKRRVQDPFSSQMIVFHVCYTCKPVFGENLGVLYRLIAILNRDKGINLNLKSNDTKNVFKETYIT